MKYDFDTYVERRGKASTKWDTYDPDILPMWIADSDFRSPPEVVEAVRQVVDFGVFGYPLVDGSFERACAHWQKSRFGWDIDADSICWCPSLGAAIGLCINSFTSPGESVAMLFPIYPPFMRLCHLNGRKPVGTILKWHDGCYTIDFAELENVLKRPEVRLFMLCNPHNPTGRVFGRSELERIGELCLKYDVTIFSDEIHADIVYSGQHLPLPTISPEIAAITIVGVNASKTFNVADLRSAAVISQNPKILHSFLHQRDRVKMAPSSLGVAGVIAAWEKCADYADQLVSYLKANLEYAVQSINNDCPGIKAYMPQATYLLWLDCLELGLSDSELMDFFLKQAKVGLNEGETFGPGGSGFMRMNVACPRKLLDEGLKRVAAALKNRSPYS